MTLVTELKLTMIMNVGLGDWYTAEALWPERLAAWERGGLPRPQLVSVARALRGRQFRSKVCAEFPVPRCKMCRRIMAVNGRWLVPRSGFCVGRPAWQGAAGRKGNKVHDAPNFKALLESLRLEKTAAQEA